MKLDVVPAHDLALTAQAEISNRAFAGYLAGWHDMDATSFAQFIRAQEIDLCYSRFVRVAGEFAGFGYINRTGNIARLAGMGTVPEARRTGAAAHLLKHLLDEAKARDDEAMVLEVFEQNLPAVPLYRRRGFRELMRLFGWRRPAGNTAMKVADQLAEISLLDAIQMARGPDFPNIPWQISRHAVTKVARARAYKIDSGCVVIGDPEKAPIRIHTLFGSEADSRSVLAGVLAKFSKCEFVAPAIFPERLAETVFQPLDFVREPLNQLLMRRDLK